MSTIMHLRAAQQLAMHAYAGLAAKGEGIRTWPLNQELLIGRWAYMHTFICGHGANGMWPSSPGYDSAFHFRAGPVCTWRQHASSGTPNDWTHGPQEAHWACTAAWQLCLLYGAAAVQRFLRLLCSVFYFFPANQCFDLGMCVPSALCHYHHSSASQPLHSSGFG